MSPEYFPRLDFFRQLLAGVPVDPTHPYTRQSFMNRTRLRTPDGWQWLTVPVVGRQRGVPISQVVIDNSVPWRGKHLRAFQYNYRSTPYFEAYEDRFVEFFEREWDTLGPLVVASIDLSQDLIGPLPPVGPQQPVTEPQPTDTTYVQNFPGFVPNLSVLDAFFNLGPAARDLIAAQPDDE